MITVYLMAAMMMMMMIAINAGVRLDEVGLSLLIPL